MQKTRQFDDVKPREILPTLAVPVTVPLIAGGAIATRDYFPGHHDLNAARALGSPNIFMNILTTNGIVQRYVETWSGSDAHFLSVRIKLGVPNYPGDTMTFSGEVSDRRSDDRSVEITLKGRNSMGNHVTGTVRVQLP